MNFRKHIFKASLFLVFGVLSSCNISKSSKYEKSVVDEVYPGDSIVCCCNYMTVDQALFWKNDSLALNGYRRTIAPFIVNDCQLINMRWDELEDYFGNPFKVLENFLFEDDEDLTVIEYYTFNADKQNQASLRTQFLIFYIRTSNNTVKHVYLRYNDF